MTTLTITILFFSFRTKNIEGQNRLYLPCLSTEKKRGEGGTNLRERVKYMDSFQMSSAFLHENLILCQYAGEKM